MTLERGLAGEIEVFRRRADKARVTFVLLHGVGSHALSFEVDAGAVALDRSDRLECAGLREIEAARQSITNTARLCRRIGRCAGPARHVPRRPCRAFAGFAVRRQLCGQLSRACFRVGAAVAGARLSRCRR